MGCLFNTVIACLLVGLTASSSQTYKAGVMNKRQPLGVDAYTQILRDAAANLDILVLPTVEKVSKSAQTDNYDEVLKSISSMANEHKMYVVSQLLEKTRCQEKTEFIRSNLVFDRQGTLISVNRRPVDPTAPCNATATDTFTTDFGVTFGVLMPEDLVLRNPEGVGVNNFVVAGEWASEISALAGPQFHTAWAFTTNANLVSSSGVFAGRAGRTGLGADLVVAELRKNGEDSTAAPVVTAPHSEDLSQYITKPLDLADSSRGVRETVCHGEFCCQFYVKTSGSQGVMSYGLAALEDTRRYGGHHNIGAQNCAVVACAGSYKRSCDVGSINDTNIIFEEIIITGNFKSKNAAHFPIILLTDTLSNNQFVFEKKLENNASHVTIKLYNGQQVVNFGIFGRDFTKDFVEKTLVFDNNDGLTYKIYEYINSEAVHDFFDYLWIRLRVLIFVVSIYVLEMM